MSEQKEQWGISEEMKEILPVMFPKESVKQFEELACQDHRPTPAESWSRYIADGLQRLIDARMFVMPGEGVERDLYTMREGSPVHIASPVFGVEETQKLGFKGIGKYRIFTRPVEEE